MESRKKRIVGILVLTVLYPITSLMVRYIPNPMVPDAHIALNMIFPVLAGFFYGPMSGATAGCLGTGGAALLYANPFDAAATLPHTFMGILAGFAGRKGIEFWSALSLLFGHILNLFFFARLGLITIPGEEIGRVSLGLAAETAIGVMAVSLLGALLKRGMFMADRW